MAQEPEERRCYRGRLSNKPDRISERPQRGGVFLLCAHVAVHESVVGPFLPRRQSAFVSVIRGKAAALLVRWRGS